MDGDGTISAEDLTKIFKRNDGIKEMISRLDINGDGKVDYEEFVQMMRAE